MHSQASMNQNFSCDGFAMVPGVLSALQCAEAGIKIVLADPAAGGTRNLLSQPWCADMAARLRLHPAVARCLKASGTAVQCTYFEKSADRNWLVPFHQDLSIPVAAKVDDPSLCGWSEKEGTLFVRPPLDVLRSLVAVRLHLDDCGVEDGPLRVMPGASQHTILQDEAIAALRATEAAVTCLASAGDALLLRPLLLHASSKGRGGSRRRVLHFVFGPAELPLGLRWALAC